MRMTNTRGARKSSGPRLCASSSGESSCPCSTVSSWSGHRYELDYLQEGIALRAYAQRDPLIEYQREGFDLFGAMMDAIKEESVAYLFNLEVQVEPEAPAAAEGAPVADDAAAVTAA